jgi:hypothetical protein
MPALYCCGPHYTEPRRRWNTYKPERIIVLSYEPEEEEEEEEEKKKKMKMKKEKNKNENSGACLRLFFPVLYSSLRSKYYRKRFDSRES